MTASDGPGPSAICVSHVHFVLEVEHKGIVIKATNLNLKRWSSALFTTFEMVVMPIFL